MIKQTIDWLDSWPCSRNFGLGTVLPGTNYVIDSLSDSTIYMCYYTIANAITKISIETINDSIFDFIFLDELDTDVIDEKLYEQLQPMQDEFKHWYPFDVRVSGRDLITNHLTMSLFNHGFIWENTNLWPRSYAINGYLMLNGEKMSKNTGNFKTLGETIKKYGTDPTRFALAESDGFDDGNFEEELASSAIMKLTIEREWICEVIDVLCEGKFEDQPDNFWGLLLTNEINIAINNAMINYEKIQFRKVLCESIYPLISIRDKYRLLCKDGLIKTNYKLSKRLY